MFIYVEMPSPHLLTRLKHYQNYSQTPCIRSSMVFLNGLWSKSCNAAAQGCSYPLCFYLAACFSCEQWVVIMGAYFDFILHVGPLHPVEGGMKKRIYLYSGLPSLASSAGCISHYPETFHYPCLWLPLMKDKHKAYTLHFKKKIAWHHKTVSSSEYPSCLFTTNY